MLYVSDSKHHTIRSYGIVPYTTSVGYGMVWCMAWCMVRTNHNNYSCLREQFPHMKICAPEPDVPQTCTSQLNNVYTMVLSLFRFFIYAESLTPSNNNHVFVTCASKKGSVVLVSTRDLVTIRCLLHIFMVVWYESHRPSDK